MKNLYTTPELNIDTLNTRDTMTASGLDGGDVSAVRENRFAWFSDINNAANIYKLKV